ncbi:hypothetical protein [Motilimonas eburnea]|uniref:hypothetical protein n=1 Tax=Motilimonas eburnea TaxID=1737488 RepID=UPI001E3C5801|nr:hypothetical protein [Motilimonas eburnea]MCE2571963.1 hypothetical protein [Motilimonas eburnea]
MENNKIFLTINRINSLLFLVLLIASLIGAVFVFQEITTSTRKNAVEITTPDKETKEVIELSDVETIRDKGIQYIRVYSKRDGVLMSGGYSKTLINLLFLSKKGEEPKWLLPDNDSNILVHRVLKTYDEQTNKSTSDYIYLEINSQSEGSRACISSIDGESLHCLDKDLNKIIQYEYFSDEGTIGLLVQVSNEIRYKVFDLESKKLESDKFVIKL